MITSQFASLKVIVPPSDYRPGQKSVAEVHTVGLAQSIRIDDNFGTKAENVIGSPLPIFHPGFMQTTIAIEKATVDRYSFRNFGAFNPLWAHVGSTYRKENLIQFSGAGSKLSQELQAALPPGASDLDQKMYPFMFVIAIQDKVAKANGNSSYVESAYPHLDDPKKQSPNMFGSYVCVLTSANISASSQNAVIMDSVNAYARPLVGTWFNEAIRDAFAAENGNNGMDNLIHSVLYGYYSDEKPKAPGVLSEPQRPNNQG